MREIKFRAWDLKRIFESYFDIDEVGQINFISTPMENDQNARIRLQRIYDEANDKT